MTYMQQLETRLKDLLDAFGAGDISRDKFIGDIKMIALESYRNGFDIGKGQAQSGGVREPATAPRPSTKNGAVRLRFEDSSITSVNAGKYMISQQLLKPTEGEPLRFWSMSSARHKQ